MMAGRACWLTLLLALPAGGCGLGVSQLPEIWDRSDPFATAHMEMQVKRAIFCELREAALEARGVNSSTYFYDRRNVTSVEDGPLPDSWGVQVTLTLTADEKSSLTPIVSIKEPLSPGRALGQSVPQSFALGLGGALSSQNIHYDKFDFYYTARDLVRNAGPADVCHAPPTKLLGPPTSSSPFVEARNLGIREWLPGAVGVTAFQRSSRSSENGEGAALGTQGSFTSDSATYDNKFLIVSDGSLSATWNLVRVGTGATPLIDLNRTRTHELLITVGPGATEKRVDKRTGRVTTRNLGPSASAFSSHLASQIGSAVAASIQGR
ncbi:hypothetical protein [Lichenibacterium dinghuense]|uniref:hypothetical protein n=1 Tax=Lichenibacterium dinghuense TaxID=2895977 RepID=UPI001F3F927F|nr:hypothetical protein [Lichenibacterium sp. 6Y81]